MSPPLFFWPESVICFLHLSHIFKYTSDYVFFIMKANTINPDQTAPKGSN